MKRVVVVGGGAAGFFGGITCATAAPEAEVLILEKGAQFLQKVRISGGGRCNVTHGCFDPRELTRHYPRGERELIGPYHRFHTRETVEWFESRGVKLKVEPDGRMFPVTDASHTIIDCLLREARKAGVQVRTNAPVERIVPKGRGFELWLSGNENLECDRVLLATGGCRTPVLGALAASLGHTLVPPVPSLFTFNIAVEWVRKLAGLSVAEVEVSAPDTEPQRGALLFTHWGLSGPAILRLSAWGARALHGLNYRFPLRIDWLPGVKKEELRMALERPGRAHPAKLVLNVPFGGLPVRLWQELVQLAGIGPEVRWSSLRRQGLHVLVQTLVRTELPVTGKSLNKDEFVTCGGVSLSEVSFKTMESRICPGLYFAGELLDIDGITGGFNFQAAWTTGWIAGRAIAASLHPGKAGTEENGGASRLGRGDLS